jgi:hypothetical protein
MKYSLLVPTRERPNEVDRFLDSVFQNTHQINNLEILFAIDNDDGISLINIEKMQHKYSKILIKYFTRNRSEMLNEDYYNWLGRQAQGDMLWIMGDDVVIVQPKWDVYITNTLECYFSKYPDRIVCASIKDNTPPPSHRLPKYPCFPMFSKETIIAQEGWLLHPKVPTWGADYVTYCIFKPLGRLLEFHNTNYLNHVSWHTKQIPEDAVNKRIGGIFNKLKMIPHYNTDRIIAEEVPTIRGHIRDYILKHNGHIEPEEYTPFDPRQKG